MGERKNFGSIKKFIGSYFFKKIESTMSKFDEELYVLRQEKFKGEGGILVK